MALPLREVPPFAKKLLCEYLRCPPIRGSRSWSFEDKGVPNPEIWERGALMTLRG